MNLKKIKPKELCTKAITYTKKYWKTPAPGNYVSLREKVAYGGAQCGIYVFSAIMGYMTFSASYYCGAIMKINYMDFYNITIISTILSYVLMFLSPIGILIFENHGVLSKKMKIFANTAYISEIIIGICLYFLPTNLGEELIPSLGMTAMPQIIANILVLNGLTSYITWFVRRKWCAKYGRLKPIIIAFGLPGAIVMSVIPFLPLQGVEYAWKLVILHFAFSLMSTFTGQFCNVQGLVTFMSPNSQERQSMYSIIPIVTGLVPSLIGMFFPILIGMTGGFTELETYRVFVPIFAFAGVIIATLCLFKVKERIIEPVDENRPKVTFFKGAKNVLKSSHLWIINISNMFAVWSNLFGSILQWWFVYSLRIEWFYGFAANIVVLSMTLGNIMTPILIKKFEKKTIIIWARIFSLVCVFIMFGAIKLSGKIVSIVLFMFACLLKNAFSPIENGINSGLTADALDYHQYKYGERADNMSSVFGILLSPVTMLIGYVLPAILKTVGFTSDWDILYDNQTIVSVFNIYIFLSIIGIVLSIIPFFFYNLTREKHDKCIQAMTDRVGKTDFEAGKAEEETPPVDIEENVIHTEVQA